MAVEDFEEIIKSEKPGDIKFAYGDATISSQYLVPFSKLALWFEDVFGSVKVNDRPLIANDITSQVGLIRKVEMSNAQFPYMYADSAKITGYQPAGKLTAAEFESAMKFYAVNKQDQNGNNLQIDYKTFDVSAIYAYYLVEITFKRKPYFALHDLQLENARNQLRDGLLPSKFEWFSRDLMKQTPRNYWDACEYLRYTTVDFDPEAKNIVANQGLSFWKTNEDNQAKEKIPPVGNTPLGAQNSSTNWQTILNNRFNVTWYKVPIEVAEFKCIKNGVGKVNYGPNYDEDEGDVKKWNFPFFGRKSGELLLTGYEVEPINNPFPQAPLSLDFVTNALTKNYCNIVFKMTERYIDPSLIYPQKRALLRNVECKMYSQGWNLAPLANKKRWYYFESGNLDIDQEFQAFPLFSPYPFQKLFNASNF